MNKLFIPDYFKPWELVGPKSFQVVYEKGLSDRFVYSLIDSRLLRVLQYVRQCYGAVIINNWYDGGSRTESGLRCPGMLHYSETSQHTFGRAADCIFTSASVESVRNDFKNGLHNGFLFANNVQVTIENEVDWFHVDVRNANHIVNFFDVKKST